MLRALAYLLPIALAVLAVIVSGRGTRPRRRERAAPAWQHLLAVERQSPRARLPAARRGAKVVIV